MSDCKQIGEYPYISDPIPIPIIKHPLYSNQKADQSLNGITAFYNNDVKGKNVHTSTLLIPLMTRPDDAQKWVDRNQRLWLHGTAYHCTKDNPCDCRTCMKTRTGEVDGTHAVHIGLFDATAFYDGEICDVILPSWHADLVEEFKARRRISPGAFVNGPVDEYRMGMLNQRYIKTKLTSLPREENERVYLVICLFPGDPLHTMPRHMRVETDKKPKWYDYRLEFPGGKLNCTQDTLHECSSIRCNEDPLLAALRETKEETGGVINITDDADITPVADFVYVQRTAWQKPDGTFLPLYDKYGSPLYKEATYRIRNTPLVDELGRYGLEQKRRHSAYYRTKVFMLKVNEVEKYLTYHLKYWPPPPE